MAGARKHWDDRLNRRLRLRDLRYLLSLVECGSMAKAAASLGVSQPAVSRAMSDLEHTLGVRLLDRSSRGVEPTIYGQALIRRGLAVFDELKQGIGEIEILADPAAGEVRIGCGEAGAAGFLAPVVAARLHGSLCQPPVPQGASS
jgi:DNA-binding transcriptional LysR family regulator